jgi:transposase
MSPFPGPQSVIIMDNARIHHQQGLINLLKGYGVQVEFLPPYSPDFNPIEEAFASIKAWIRRNDEYVNSVEDYELPLIEACGQIGVDEARGYFKHLIYI